MLTAIARLPAAAASISPLLPASYSEVASESFAPLSLPYQASAAPDTTVSVSMFGGTVMAQTSSGGGGSALASLFASESSLAFFAYSSGFGSGGSIQYSIEVVGPQGAPRFAVPVTVSAKGAAGGIESVSGLGPYDAVTFSASASIEVTGNGVQTGPSGELADSAIVSQANPGTQSFALSQEVMFIPNLPAEVTMEAETGASLECFGCGGLPGVEETASAFASIDPAFAIAPPFAGEYSLIVSPGVDLTPVVVPEPSYFGLLAAGLGALVSCQVIRKLLRPSRD